MSKRMRLPYGSRRRRLAQALGFVFNDDGTWSPLRLKSAKGEEAIAAEREQFEQTADTTPPAGS